MDELIVRLLTFSEADEPLLNLRTGDTITLISETFVLTVFSDEPLLSYIPDRCPCGREWDYDMNNLWSVKTKFVGFRGSIYCRIHKEMPIKVQICTGGHKIYALTV